MTYNKALVLFAHPDIASSRINVAMLNAARGVDGVTIHDLYQEYPDFKVDVAREQALLTEHDVIIMQFPLYWYSAPSLLKEWMDVVLTFGFAFGEGGDALEGKPLQLVLTAGGDEGSYGEEGHNRYSLPELLRPFEQTAQFCRMEYLSPYVVHEVYQLSDDDVVAAAENYASYLTNSVMQMS